MLIKHFFLPKSKKRKRKEHTPDPAMLILEWLLITVRSWDVAELNEERDYLRASAEIHYPGLTREIEPFLRLIPQNCASTLEAFGFACEISKSSENMLGSWNSNRASGKAKRDRELTTPHQKRHQTRPVRRTRRKLCKAAKDPFRRR